MIKMSVRQKYGAQIGRIDWQRFAITQPKLLVTLEQSAISKDADIQVFDEKFGACNGSGAAEKCQVHLAARNITLLSCARSRRILNGLYIVQQVVDVVRLKLKGRHVRVPDEDALAKGFLEATDWILEGYAAERQRVRVRTLVCSADRVAARAKAGGDFLPG